VDAARFAEWVWYGRGVGPAAARAALAPAELLFRLGAAARAAMYDAAILRAHALGLPALCVGNLTVGGTGKTPVAAWACAELRRRGARPALLIRGVGGDEPRVHALLNPDVPVLADPTGCAAPRAPRRAGRTRSCSTTRSSTDARTATSTLCS
jgi:tetraacyldisaccharide 4'-kinase